MNAVFTLLDHLGGDVFAKDACKGIVIYTHGSSRNSAEIFLVEFEGPSCVAVHKMDSELGYSKC